MRNKHVNSSADIVQPTSADVPAIHWSDYVKTRPHSGVLMYLVPHSVSTAYAIAGLTRLTCRRKQLGYSPLQGMQSTTVFYAGSVENYYLWQQVVRSASRAKDSASLSIKQMHTDPDLNWLLGQPRVRLETLMRGPSVPKVLILPVSARALASVPLDDIASLREHAHSFGTQLVLVTHAPSVEEFGAVASMVDDTILSDPCEADPDFDLAWTAEFSSAKAFHQDGLGKIMMQIGSDGRKARFSCNRFVSTDMIDRVIWNLAAEGHERSAIANVVHMCVDAVDRRLATLRPLRFSHVRSDWRATVSSLFDFSSLER